MAGFIRKVERYRPAWIAFHGKEAARQYLRGVTGRRDDIRLGQRALQGLLRAEAGGWAAPHGQTRHVPAGRAAGCWPLALLQIAIRVLRDAAEAGRDDHPAMTVLSGAEARTAARTCRGAQHWGC